jgi:multiple sugar transport system substrate-binding protein
MSFFVLQAMKEYKTLAVTICPSLGKVKISYSSVGIRSKRTYQSFDEPTPLCQYLSMFEGIRHKLTGSTWGHERGYGPLIAMSEKSAELFPADVKWEIRTLQQFADHSFEDLANRYDLIVFDHPFIGEVAEQGYLVPLDTLLDQSFMKDQQENSVGKSHQSYVWNNQTYALAVDVAGHVSACRSDIFENLNIPLPRTWADVLELAEKQHQANAPRVAIPSIPVDIWCLFMTICANQGVKPYQDEMVVVERNLGIKVITQIARLLEFSPVQARNWNPIKLLDAMSSTDDVLYCPALFGYSNYSTSGFAKSLVTFGEIPDAGFGSTGGILGGAGIGVSSKSKYPHEAAQIAKILSSPEIQRTLYAKEGGQPGHRTAWLSPDINSDTHDFYSNTLATLDASYLRPRFPGFVQIQSESAEVIAKGVYGEISFTEALDQADDIYRQHFNS